MAPLNIFVGVSLLMVSVVSDSQICPVLEERGITLTCPVSFSNSNSKQFSWIKKVNGSTSTLATCNPNNGCSPSATNLPYTFTVTSLNASSATSSMTILSVARTDQGSWFCSGTALTQEVEVCDLIVYATPTTVSCSQPELRNDNVTVGCTGDRVYPQPFCLLSWIRDGVELQSAYNETIKIQFLSQPQNSDYFYPECTWTIPVQTMGFGSHQFRALIYPNVTGNATADINYGRNSSLTSPVDINLPAVELNPCPQEYLKPGTRSFCICSETNNTFLQANVHWSGFPLGYSEKKTSSIFFTAQAYGQRYMCNAWIFDKVASQELIPLVAYGPDQVVMKVQINGVDKTVIDLCGKPPTSQTMTVSCSVPDARPNATVTYFINGNDHTVGSAGYIYYQVTGGGNLSIKCTANNNIFPEMFTENTTSLLVREAPNTPVVEFEQSNLIFSTIKDQQVTVREGLVRIRCRVDGGYPNVTNLALNCNGSQNTFAGNTVSVEMNVTRKMNSQSCTCTATHEAICYSVNAASATLNVLYPPTVTNFTVVGAVNQEVQDNTNVMFSCEAEGNPAPSLTLLRDSDSQILGHADSSNKAILQLNKTIACQDSGIYVCKAQSREDEQKYTVKIYVLCKQQLAPTEIQNRVYSIQANQTFDINITMFGYPDPQLLLLQSSTALQEGTYNLAYYTTTPGNGVINLKIYTFLETYFQKYKLTITNIQGSFVYNFEVVEESVQHNDSSSGVKAIIGGIIAGIVAIVLVAVVVYIAKRKGLFNECIQRKSAPIVGYEIGEYEENVPPIPEYRASPLLNGSNMSRQAADPHYMDSDQESSPYIEIDDVQLATTYTSCENEAQNRNRDSQKYSPYKEIRTVVGRSSTRGTTKMGVAQPYDVTSVPDSSSDGSTTNVKVVQPHLDYTELEDAGSADSGIM